MTQCDSDKAKGCSTMGRVEVVAAIDSLVEQVAHLRKTLEQRALKGTSVVTACGDMQAVDTAHSGGIGA